MYFKRIEMHGFKSFAEPVTIEFDKGITCVVGPNGSGKSNISDAIRWVLGEQSPKMLRGSRMDDVIFAGTANRKSRGMAEVTLVIDNSGGVLPIEYSEVAITRRMYRSGESEYAINNNQCRMKDIRELLMDTGIGVDGYSLIGQGKISEIISNKTESIREIFEETAGIVSYRSKKAEAERKLAAASDNMARVTDIISEIESRIGGLKEDSEKAAEYLKLKERYKKLEVNITVKNVEDITQKAETISEELSQLAGELAAASNEKEHFDEKQREHRSRIEELEKEYRYTDEELKRSTEEVGRLTGEKNVSLERLAAVKKDSQRLEREITEIKEKAEREQENRNSLLLQKTEIDKRYTKLAEELEVESKSHGDALNKREEISNHVESMKNELFELSTKKSGWNAQKNSLESLAENLMKNRDELMRSSKDGADRLENFRKDYDELLEKEHKLSKKLDSLRSEYDALTDEKKQAEKAKTEAERNAAEAQLKIGQVAARKKAIEEMESNYDGYNNGVRFVMKAGIKGIDGVVADLMKVPKGYETALETALGAAMQNVVCKDDSTAKEGIRLLKDKRAGRITFLPIESVKGRGIAKDREVESLAGFAGYAVECVSFDEKYKGIMEYLLGNVAIIDNMDNAVRISKKGKRGLRYVTLDGEVINASGAVTGGKYKHKSANIFERKSEIAALEKNIAELEKKKAENDNRCDEAVKQIRKITEKTEFAEKEIRTSEINLMDISAQRGISEKTLKDIQRESQVRESSIKDADEQRVKLEEQIVQLMEKISSAEEMIKKNEEAILAENEKLGNMTEEIENVAEKITGARLRLNSCESEKEKTDSLLDIIDQTISSCEADIAHRQKQIEENDSNIEALCDSVSLGEQEIEKHTADREKHEIKLEQIADEKSLCMKKNNELAAAGEELSKKLVNLQNRKYDVDLKQAKYESQMENLKNKLWEDFEISYAQALSMKEENFVMSAAVKENRQIKNRLRELGDVNVGSINEYAQVKERYEFLTEQRADIQKSTDELSSIIADTDRIIKKKFKESFDQVTEHFEKIFVEFFGGGHAKISLDNEEDPLNATIEITAQPPGKQLKNINLLSGGEKTMTAIALMFAVLRTKPTPCCILDEVEAALDDHNIHVFANYLKKFENIQFTLITHQKTTMEHADVMYGVTMPERGISKVFSLKMNDELPV